MARPGMIFVRSGTLSPEFTLSDLTSWYEDLHIPAVLATRGVTAAARYQLVSTSAAGDKGSDEGSDGASTDLIYLTVYHLPDMNWLHSEDCEFWHLPLDVPGKEEGTRRSIFEVAEFVTSFWEFLGREDRVGKVSEGCGPEPLEQLIIGCLRTRGHHEHAMQMMRGSLHAVSGGGYRCSVFKIDESRPCPPSGKGQKNDEVDGMVENWMGQNFCFFEYSDPDVDTSWATPSFTLRLTLLSASGDFSKTPF